MRLIPQFRFTKARGFRCPIFRLPTRRVFYGGTQVQWMWWRIILVWE